jgi:(p)ppGpp synthase/HD superfamily hydrolase
MATLQRAIELTVLLHSKQVDKSGQPYILHPMRIMLRCSTAEERQAAIMHDLIEDTNLTIEELAKEGFCQSVIDCVNCLTRRDGETYADFIERCCENSMAIKIKLLDIADNMDVTRLDTLGESDLGRLKRYHRARKRLLEAQGAISIV